MEDISCGLESKAVPCEPCYMSSGAILYPDSFRYVTRNIPGPGSNRDLFEDQLCGCHCTQGCNLKTCPCLKRFGSNYHPLTGQLIPEAVTSSTLKPIFECNSQCKCDAVCSNRLVQHGVKVRLKVAPSSTKGFGLFACEDIPQLAFVCEYAGEVVSPSKARQRLERCNAEMNYLIVLREHCSTGVLYTCVDPKHIGNVGRFANHSCDPNLLMLPVRVDNSVPKLALFARRNIRAGDELTFDYSGETVLHSQCSGTVEQSEGKELDDTNHSISKQSVTSPKPEQEVILTVVNSYSNKSDVNVIESTRSDRNAVDHVETSTDISILPASEFHMVETAKTVTCCGSPKQFENHVHESNVDSGYLRWISNDNRVNSKNGKKRKLSEGGDEDCRTDHKECVVNPQSRHKQTKHFDSTTEMLATVKKPCLCGSSCCKGYLPFDSLIFS